MTNAASDDARIGALTRELDELRGRQEAVAGVLRALSRSGLRLQPILDQIVETAARICEADSGFLYLAEHLDGRFEPASRVGAGRVPTRAGSVGRRPVRSRRGVSPIPTTSGRDAGYHALFLGLLVAQVRSRVRSRRRAGRSRSSFSPSRVPIIAASAACLLGWRGP